MNAGLQPISNHLPDLAELATRVLQHAAANNWSLAAAESCTGGLIAATLTGIEGLSSSFKGGFVTYCDETKHALLEIPAEHISRYGAVSDQIARAMASHARRLASVDFAVAATGFTGDAGAEENGLVYVAVAAKDRLLVRELYLGEVGRNEGRALSAEAALTLLRDVLEAAA